MILMVALNCLLTGIKSRDRNYLDLSLFFAGTLINAISNLYTHFFLPTIEPYIGSWISLLAFILFSYNYLNIKDVKTVTRGRTMLAGACIFFFLLSIVHNILNKNQNNLTILIMDISAALIILMLLISLIFLRVRGNKKAGTLIIFESLMIIGAVSAMGIFKDAVVDIGVPATLLQGNFLFLAGMAFNALLFSFILGTEMNEVKISHALAELEKNKLKKLYKAKNDIMMNISHELRTPTTIINGIVHQLRTGRWGNSIKAADAQFETIERNNLRLIKQINGLLELSQLEQHRFKLKPVKINLNKRLPLFAAEFHAIAEQKNIKINVNCSKNIELAADPHLLDTALLNLLGNSVKFTQDGGLLELNAYKKNNHIVIEVGDNGPGIPEEQQEKIFHRFQQVENTRTSLYRGAGIGLSLVKGIMELHEGKVKLESHSEKGCKFSLFFPEKTDTQEAGNTIEIDPIVSAYKADLETAVTDSKPAAKQSVITDNSKKTVLLVEDNKDLLNFLESELSENFSVATAQNGKIALEILSIFKPSLIISDIMMPEMDGRQLYSEIHKTPEYTRIPFLFLTARNSAEEKVEALNEGAVDYISKPFSIEELRAKASAIINSVEHNNKDYQKKLKKSVVEFIDNFETNKKNRFGNDFKCICTEKELTTREKDIAILIRKGMSDKEIASSLILSVKTISNYNTSIFRKLNVAGRSELIALNRQ